MDMGDRMPSQVMDEQVICCWIDDPVGIEMRHKMNVDMICWECDYPHSDSTWPQSPEQFMKQMQASNCSDEDIDKISHANAMRLYKYDPFSILGKENCTVGALRAQAEGWDVSIVARGIKATRHRRDRPREVRQGRPVEAAALCRHPTDRSARRQPTHRSRAGPLRRPRRVAQPRHEPDPAERPQRPLLLGVDHHRVARLAPTMNETTQSSQAVVPAITQSPQSIVRGSVAMRRS